MMRLSSSLVSVASRRLSPGTPEIIDAKRAFDGSGDISSEITSVPTRCGSGRLACRRANDNAAFHHTALLCVGIIRSPARYRLEGDDTWMHRTGTLATGVTATIVR